MASHSRQQPLAPTLISESNLSPSVKEQEQWFEAHLVVVRQNILTMIQNLESDCCDPNLYKDCPDFKIEERSWQKQKNESYEADIKDAGGGEYRIVSGRVFEKATVNISKVCGRFPPEFVSDIPGAKKNDGIYEAQGLSTVIHPRNPHVPAIHMNMRCLTTSLRWFGGCADLNPMTPLESRHQDDFHKSMRLACEKFNPTCYPAFAQACDAYFDIPHRKRTRGIGGIFFDYMPPAPDPKNLIEGMGQAFCDSYTNLCKILINRAWTPEDKHIQEQNRGYYAEFNLIYDRGTRFGFKTSGHTEAILMALPPTASWPTPS